MYNALEQIKKARMDAGLTQTQAAELIHKGCRAWQQYEAGAQRRVKRQAATRETLTNKRASGGLSA